MRSWLVVFVLLLSTACSTSGHRSIAISSDELLTGAALGLSPATVPLTSRDAAMALDDEMREFLESSIGKVSQESAILAQLVTRMRDYGFFTLEYVVDDTHTARETFHLKRGNCISFTLLFVALARASGLDARYQIVRVPPVWNADVELTVIANHISALIEASGREYVIDFNATELSSRHPRRTISDDYAIALFFNNLGAEALIAMDYAAAYHYFREAITIEPNVSDPWVNLGLLYARHDLPEHAESAYLRSLEIDPEQRSALTNLANLYNALGNTTLAEEYQERIRRYQQRNPFYHFVLARQAFDENRLEDAREAMARAIRLKRDEHDFYYLLGLTQMELGEYERAEDSLARAREHAASSDLKEKYTEALVALREARPSAASAESPAAPRRGF